MSKLAIRKPAEITSAVVYRCTERATGTIFYLVPSDSQPGDFHTVRFDEQSARYTCSCMARKPCKHIRAISEVQQAKRELVAEKLPVPALPVAVRVLDGRTACLDLGDHREVVRTCELPRIFLNGYRLIEKDDPERDAWDARMSQLEDRTSEGVADAAWIAQVRTCLPVATIPDDDMPAHVQDSIESGEFDIDAERAAYNAMTPEQRREYDCNMFGLYDFESYSAA